jgi:hypothetical protein
VAPWLAPASSPAQAPKTRVIRPATANAPAFACGDHIGLLPEAARPSERTEGAWMVEPSARLHRLTTAFTVGEAFLGRWLQARERCPRQPAGRERESHVPPGVPRTEGRGTVGRAFRRPWALEVSGQDGPLSLGGPKQRIVLAHLVLGANKVVSAEHLIDALWGEGSARQSKSTLRSVRLELRSVLRSEAIERARAGLPAQGRTPGGGRPAVRGSARRGQGNGSEAPVTDRILTEALDLLARTRPGGPYR